MKTAIIFGSSHGNTRRVAHEVRKNLAVPCEIHDARELSDPQSLPDYQLLLFFCPTYGDEELQEDMETLFIRRPWRLDGRSFAICELGSYYGYDDFSFGAMPILRRLLRDKGGTELCEPLSLDSFPRLHWDHLICWVDYLNCHLPKSCRT